MKEQWEYNKEKHEVVEQPTIKQPDNSTGWSEDSNGLQYKDLYHQNLDKEVQERYDKHISSLRHIPVSGEVDWKDGEDVTGKFKERQIKNEFYDTSFTVAIPIKVIL